MCEPGCVSLYVGLSPSGGPVAGVALLPFVDERRLRAALGDVYPDLSTEEGKTNGRGGLIPVDQWQGGTHSGRPTAMGHSYRWTNSKE